MKLKDIHNWSTERISQRVLYALVILAILVFGLFYLIGYDRPYDEDPNFNAPLFTDAVIILMIVLVLVTVAIAVWAVYSGLRKRGRADRLDNNIPVKKISYIVSVGTFVLLIFSFLIGSSSVMMINGKQFSDVLWLKVADMFIYASLILMFVALSAVVYGATRYYRKDRK